MPSQAFSVHSLNTANVARYMETTTLRKELGLLDVYAVAVGTTLSSGFFLLPGLAFAQAGPAVLVSYLLAGLLLILLWFPGAGGTNVTLDHFADFTGRGGHAIFATTGLVYISYAGLTKITSIAEEVKDPDRNLPLGMFLALITAVGLYVIGTTIMVGATPPAALAGDLTPAATAADHFAGPWGGCVVAGAALLAFFAAANAGVLSASRYPLAMSRDRLLPALLQRFNAKRIPDVSVYVTVGTILAILISVDPLKIAKLASAFQLVMFSLMCLAVIVMREILKEKGMREDDPYREVVTRADVLDAGGAATFKEVVARSSDLLSRHLPATAETRAAKFEEESGLGMTPVTQGVALPHLRMAGIERLYMVIARIAEGIPAREIEGSDGAVRDDRIYAALFLVSPRGDAGRHLRLLAQLARQIDAEDFIKRWQSARSEPMMKELLLPDEHVLSLRLRPDSKAAPMIGLQLEEAAFPAPSLVAFIHRDGKTIVPRGTTTLRAGDRLTVVGEPEDLAALRVRYGA